MLPPRFLRGVYCSGSLWSLALILIIGISANIILSDSSERPYYVSESSVHTNISNFGYGGPIDESTTNNPGTISTANPILLVDNEEPTPSFLYDGSFLSLSGPSITLTSSGIKKYRVQKGDSIESIALKFNISTETLKLTNLGSESGIKTGQSLIILPISGVIHEVKDGDTLKSISNLYHIKTSLIEKFNSDISSLLEKPGSLLVIPYGEPIKETIIAGNRAEPEVRYYFTLPARGWNWGVLHPNNAVDIADSCGSPIYAAQEGLVIEESGSNSWNQGYGNFIVIEHPNNTKTKYAHNKRNLVKIGAYVKQGQAIAEIGSTGKTHGVTGCHLHFEVLGAKNPFAIN